VFSIHIPPPPPSTKARARVIDKITLIDAVFSRVKERVRVKGKVPPAAMTSRTPALRYAGFEPWTCLPDVEVRLQLQAVN